MKPPVPPTQADTPVRLRANLSPHRARLVWQVGKSKRCRPLSHLPSKLRPRPKRVVIDQEAVTVWLARHTFNPVVAVSDDRSGMPPIRDLRVLGCSIPGHPLDDRAATHRRTGVMVEDWRDDDVGRSALDRVPNGAIPRTPDLVCIDGDDPVRTASNRLLGECRHLFRLSVGGIEIVNDRYRQLLRKPLEDLACPVVAEIVGDDQVVDPL